MSMKLTRAAYEQVIAENIAWLEKQPRTLEREHIRAVLEASPDREYRPTPEQTRAATVAYIREALSAWRHGPIGFDYVEWSDVVRVLDALAKEGT